ncbi:Stf0 family sulfotransferase [Marinibacterium sp. SX1]|uniref:Stf0 family sulfotransferase n=1 Tax=Marinibacterium sp. SX1 TaxID=3388424 RepID=UPI003D181A1F
MLSKFEWMREKFTSGAVDPFKDVVFDEKKFNTAMGWEPAATRYVVFFTPRSGSSRLTDLAVKTKALGNPGECFNPAFLPAIGQAYSARSLQEYVPLLLRHRQTRGVFGCEVTHMHVLANYRTGQAFLDAVQPTATLWLMREDIVAQAVSVSRMMQTKVSHSVSADESAIAQAESVFRYDPKVIRNVLRRLRWMEDGTETLIREAGLTPMRLSYERTVTMRPRRMMALIGSHVGVKARRMDLDALESDHKKISGEKSNDFAERFRAEHADMIAEMDAERAPMLAAHAAAQDAMAAQRKADPETPS